jgi:hypothetical protein
MSLTATDLIILNVTDDWDPTNTTPEFSLDTVSLRQYLKMHAPGGCSVVIYLNSGNPDRDGTYLGEILDISEAYNVFTVELM